jgi:predicted Zn-dependent protease
MTMTMRAIVLKLLMFSALTVFLAHIAPAQTDVPMQAMKDEMARSVSQLRLETMEKPYFLAYRMEETNQAKISGMLGSLTEQTPSRVRWISVEVRVGDYALDNSNYFSLRELAGGMQNLMSGFGQAPLDDNYAQIRRAFWLTTDAQYKKAVELLTAKQAALQMQKRADDLPDFSKEKPAHETEAPASTLPSDDWKELVRTVSAVFQKTPEIQNSSVDLEFRNHFTRYLNSESSSFTRARTIFKLTIQGSTQASDGLPISDSIEYYGRTRADLPATEAIVSATQAMAERILKLRSAATLDRYNGPVLFESDAAGEVFAQQFAASLTAIRTPASDDPRFEMFFSQMMARLGGVSLIDKVGGRVLPEFLSLNDNPLQSEYKGSQLLGASKIDDDAVMTRETKIVDHGVLKTLLTARTPVRGIDHSTGSRRGMGASPSNLFLSSEKTSGGEQLRQELLRLAKARGLDYGIIVRRVGGGTAASFMRMAARMAQQDMEGDGALAEVYKLHADGHQELLRGVEVSEMPLSAFKDIVAVGDTPQVATDEFIPRLSAFFSMNISSAADLPLVSYVVPSLLFDEVSLAKSTGPFPNPPISPSPLAEK